MSLNSKQLDRTLLLAGTNAERLELTAKLRQAMQSRGELGADTFCLSSLRNRNLTTAQASYASYYEQGDVLVPSQDYKRQGLVKYQQYRVVEIDHDANRLTVETPDGKLLMIDPARCQRKTVYAVQEIAVAKGDRLRWTRNNRTAKIRNGQRFTVAEIDSSGNAQIVDDRGNCSHINLRGLHYLDYALVGTTYSSQGKTADRVLALMDGTTSRESFYVAASRAKHHLSIYTADIAELAQLAQRSRAKENASDYIPLFQVVNSHAQTQKENNSVYLSTFDSRNVRESLGNRIAENLAATLLRNSRATEGKPSNSEISGRFRCSKGRYSSLIRQLEQASSKLDGSTNAIEPETHQIVRVINKQQYGRQLRETSDMLRAIGESLSRLEYQSSQQQQLSERIGRFLSQSQSVARVDRLNRKQTFQALWNQYSRNVQVKHPQALDRAVASMALRNRHSRKSIGLILAAGSPNVRQLYQASGKHQALIYVRHVVNSIFLNKETNKIAKAKHQIEF